MARLKALNPEEATGKTKELFDSVNSKMGMVPNMMRTMGELSGSTQWIPGIQRCTEQLFHRQQTWRTDFLNCSERKWL